MKLSCQINKNIDNNFIGKPISDYDILKMELIRWRIIFICMLPMP
jgi:hypothetical protein